MGCFFEGNHCFQSCSAFMKSLFFCQQLGSTFPMVCCTKRRSKGMQKNSFVTCKGDRSNHKLYKHTCLVIHAKKSVLCNQSGKSEFYHWFKINLKYCRLFHVSCTCWMLIVKSHVFWVFLWFFSRNPQGKLIPFVIFKILSCQKVLGTLGSVDLLLGRMSSMNTNKCLYSLEYHRQSI